MIAIQRALMRHAGDGERRWVAFESPLDTFTAWSLDDVIPTLVAAERAARDGMWVVGMVAYDAGPAFDPAIVSDRDTDVPLVALAAFAEATPSTGPHDAAFATGAWVTSDRQDEYEGAVAAIHERIAAGDTYQVNYTMRLDTAFDGAPEGLFAALCRAQPADHLAFLDFGDAAACSVSPELFVRRQGRSVEARPMKGTRPRHPDPEADEELARALVASEKDRAENTMIVDMVRNDLGRIADVGSVQTTSLHTVERYPTVHQLTSTVTATTDRGVTDLFIATFPGASITGAPKISTSGIIAELERRPRGLYTGAIGVISPGGDAEFSIAIRTVWVDRVAGRATYGVGGGIVWDSTGPDEWQEALTKAAVLERATRPFQLIETMAWTPSAGVALLDGHLERLATSAAHFGFSCDIDAIAEAVRAVDADDPQKLRLLLAPDGGFDLAPTAMPASIVGPWRVVVDSEPVRADDEFLHHKTTRRDRYDEAAARRGSADDVVMWNTSGEVTETTIANLVLDVDGEQVTPRQAAGLLPGVGRNALLVRGHVREAEVTIDDLLRADAVWAINALRGRWRVEIDRTSPGIEAARAVRRSIPPDMTTPRPVHHTAPSPPGEPVRH